MTSSGLVPRTGFEPAHPCERCDLNTVRLPISPPGLVFLFRAANIGNDCICYTLTLKSLNASFKLVFRSVLGLRWPMIKAQLTPYSPAGNFLL